MPDVLASSGTRTHGIAHSTRWQMGQVELQDDQCNLSRIDAYCFFPADFIRVRLHRRRHEPPVSRYALEWLTLKELNVHEVEEDGMRVHGEIHDLPHFGRTCVWRLGWI